MNAKDVITQCLAGNELIAKHILHNLRENGLVVVPREPTEEMDLAGLDDPDADYCDRCMQTGHTRNSGWPSVIWKAMLTAWENSHD